MLCKTKKLFKNQSKFYFTSNGPKIGILKNERLTVLKFLREVNGFVKSAPDQLDRREERPPRRAAQQRVPEAQQQPQEPADYRALVGRRTKVEVRAVFKKFFFARDRCYDF
jgi:hypothetical protein